VADQRPVLDQQRMHATEHVLVGILRYFSERLVQQLADRSRAAVAEIGSMRRPQFGHLGLSPRVHS